MTFLTLITILLQISIAVETGIDEIDVQRINADPCSVTQSDAVFLEKHNSSVERQIRRCDALRDSRSLESTMPWREGGQND